MLSKAEVQRLRSLRDKKHRETLGLFAVEGEKVVGELIAVSYPFETVYGTAAWSGSAEGADGGASTAIQVISDKDMARISHFPTPSTVFAVGRIRRDPLAPGDLDHGLTLVLDEVQDAGNVGTAIRVADWFGLDRVVVSQDCADLFSQKVLQSSMGSFARVRTHVADLAEVLAAVKVPVLGCDLKGDDIHRLPRLADAVIAIGSEGRGLTPAVRRWVTRSVTIPRIGGGESLNAAVAAAIVCDNLRRVQR